MHLSKVFLVCLVCTLQLALASITEFGKCPKNIQTMQNFNIKDYEGRWYEYSRYTIKFKLHPNCAYSEYKVLPDGTMSIFNSANNDTFYDPKESTTGLAVPDTPAKFFLWMDGEDSFSDYWVLGTDYDNYAVVYSCYRWGIFSNKMVWILTRDPLPSQKVIETAENIVKQNKLPVESLKKTSHKDCVYD